MKFKIETVKLISMLDDVRKGVGNSKIMPITGYLLFEIDKGQLSITATDLTNFITRSAGEVEGEDGSIVIHAGSIINLASKTTKNEMQFKVIDNYVEVKGNGTYKVEMLDEEYPTYEFNGEADKHEIDVDRLKNAFKVNKPSVSKEMLTPVLSGYRVGDKMITTDGIKMAINQAELLDEIEFLSTQQMADLIAVIKEKTATIQKDGTKILITAGDVIIFGNELEGISDYPDITPLLDLEHEGNVLIDKKELMRILERLSIFADPFENNGVTMIFKKDKLELSDLKRKSIETVEYIEVVKMPETVVDVSVNIEYFKELIDVLEDDEVNLFYGEGLPLKMEENEVTEILSAMELDEENEEEE